MNAKVIREFLCEYAGPGVIETRILPLRGGLESCGTARVDASKRGGSVSSFVVKHVVADAARELHVYRALGRLSSGISTPRLLGWRDTGFDGMYLFLEWVAPCDTWPWKDLEATGLVIEQLERRQR